MRLAIAFICTTIRAVMTISWRACILCFGMIAIWPMASTARAGAIVDLDFTTLTTLPSANGLTFVASPGVLEADVFNISGGLLHMNTIGQSSDVEAYYQLIPGFDSSLDAVLETRLRVLDLSGNFGLVTFLSDQVLAGPVINGRLGPFTGRVQPTPFRTKQHSTISS
jgi:hypothetical protein